MHIREVPLLGGGHSFWGHLPDFSTDKLALMKLIVERSEPMVRIHTPLPREVVAVNDPDVLRELLVEKAHIFQKSYLMRYALYPLAGEGLFTAHWDRWKPNRKLMSPLFQPSELGRYAEAMSACADQTIRAFEDGKAREIFEDTTRMTMSVAGKTLFDADTFSEADEIGNALTVALGWANENTPSAMALAHVLTRIFTHFVADKMAPVIAAPMREFADTLTGPRYAFGESTRKMEAAIALLDRRVQTMIDERRAHPTGKTDLLAKLLGAHDENEAMSDKQVRDEILTLFIAGHETTASGLAWTLYLLCKHPDIYEAVEREVDAIQGAPTMENLKSLSLTLRCFKEALRLYPPVYVFPRQATEATTLAGYEVPKNTLTFVSPYALHRRPELWPEPEKFDPDRFLPEREAARHRLAWLPFGAGPRVCIGNHFAMMEAQILLARMLYTHRFELDGDDEPMPFTTLRPKHGVRVKAYARHPLPPL